MEEEEPTHFGALRLIELADRPSDVMKSSATDALLHTDPLLAIFRTFSELNGLTVSAALSIVPFAALATSVGEHVRAAGAQLVLVPWLPSAQAAPEAATTPDTSGPAATTTGDADRGPFDALFRTADRSTSLLHSDFVRGVFAQAGSNVALLVGRAPLGSGVREETRLFLPFFGGPDDRLALDFVVQLCANPRVRATIMRVTKCDVRAELAHPEAAHRAHHTHKDMGKMEVDVQTNLMTVASVRSVRHTHTHTLHFPPFVDATDRRQRRASKIRCMETRRPIRGCSPRRPTASPGRGTLLPRPRPSTR